MTGVEHLLASRFKLKTDFETPSRVLRSKPVRTIYTARKNGQIYKLILDNDSLIQIWKFPSHLQAKNQFLSKKKTHRRRGWQGTTKFVDHPEEKIELPQEKEVKGITSSRKEKKNRQRYVKILGRKILLN
jgi:hypothetical protein